MAGLTVLEKYALLGGFSGNSFAYITPDVITLTLRQ